MDLLNYKIQHILFGVGKVIEEDGKYITVEFKDEKRKFVYPDAFEKHILPVDPKLQEVINFDIEAKKVADKETRKIKEEKLHEELSNSGTKGSTRSIGKKEKRLERELGKAKIFYVFQGQTFESEYKGGYIWAPKYSAGDRTCHHWDRLLDVREGDIILHGSNGLIKAVSFAKGSCYDEIIPKELEDGSTWESEGRRVDCEYSLIPNPIKTSDFKGDIIKYCNVKYAPFDKDGNGNMGYLFEIDYRLVNTFIKETIELNPSLKDLDYLKNILN
jgi:hypothetical protein